MKCQSMNELLSSTTALASFARQLNANNALPSGKEFDRMESNNQSKSPCAFLASDIDSFTTATIAPLQSLLAEVPQLKMRCEHRRSAMNIMLRYEKKIAELKLASRSAETARIQRNRAKLQAVATRFKELDESIRADIKAFLTQDMTATTGKAIEQQLLSAQERTATIVQTETANILRTIHAFNLTTSKLDTHGQHLTVAAKHQRNQSEDPATSENQEANDTFPTETSLSTPAEVAVAELDVVSGIQIMPKHVLNESRSLRPRKKHTQGTRTWNLHRQIKDSMARGLDMLDCVQVPEGTMAEEWIAVHIIDFFNEISLLYGTVSELCTSTSCPQMTAGPCYTYLWADGVQQVTPISLPAPEYIARLMQWVEDQLNDATLFPPDGKYDATSGNASPEEFLDMAKIMFKRLFRVYAHMYHSHLDNYQALAAESHLNFCFKRFVLFVQHFDLVEAKELNALRKLIQKLSVEY
ncbi:TPA: hypothetical protein N0F65_009673 [Lagenidium giganteum]|uniref:Uncharacterized protein n=1 Tax=Lagenidium giganteum TaxID=4803 RepID=A0AAV2YRQ3_9STRA|nr:TPA: hypothetical protein N0F65_009673 [Lagenidium giganteum]